MTYAIIRGSNGRRHEVDFGDSPVRVEVYAREETVEIFVEADSETLPEERRIGRAGDCARMMRPPTEAASPNEVVATNLY
jgi:hypothetical protein